MGEEHAVSLAQVVQSRFAVGRLAEAVLGTFAVAGEEPGALAALAGQAVALGLPELQLPFAVHHFHEALRVDVSQAVFGEDEVVAGVDVAVELHHSGVAARGCQGADARLLAHPVGQGCVEELDEYRAHVFLDPLVEQCAEERAPLPGRYGKLGQACVAPVVGRGQVASVGMGQDALDDGGELQVVAAYLSEEVVELARVAGVEVVDDGHRVPLHAVLLQQFDAAHHFHERGSSLAVAAVFVVKLLRPVYRDAYQPVVFAEELAPLVGQQRSVGLDAVVDGASAGVTPLQLHGFLVEGEGAHQRFAPVPGEQYRRQGLGLDVLAHELFQQFVAHHVLG